MNLEFYRQIFEKYSYVTYNKNPVLWNPGCSMQTRVTKLKSRFSQLCELAHKRLISTTYKNFYVYWGFL